jgi:hypothetical protein
MVRPRSVRRSASSSLAQTVAGKSRHSTLRSKQKDVSHNIGPAYPTRRAVRNGRSVVLRVTVAHEPHRIARQHRAMRSVYASRTGREHDERASIVVEVGDAHDGRRGSALLRREPGADARALASAPTRAGR